MVLFRITFLKNIYGLDCRSFLYTVASKEELDKLCSDLLQDTEAMAILSTHAVNFIYLYQRVISERGEVPVETMFEIAKYYKRDDNIHLQLFIYLYTHCIIGETQFYYRHIPEADKPLYVKMVQELENLIDERFYDINLDNKCEFLVCAKIVGYKTHLEPRIFAEAEQSVSENGKFLVDRHNNNPQTDNITLDKSEHRNVLYIMANRDFTPLA
jgi:hypothetical protein